MPALLNPHCTALTLLPPPWGVNFYSMVFLILNLLWFFSVLGAGSSFLGDV